MNFKKEHGVSEVVGVLLMLTVTILLVSSVAIIMNNSVETTEKPITADIVATDIDDGNVILELISGDSFSLDLISIKLGIREESDKSVILKGDSFESYTNSRIISLGDRFKIRGEQNGTTIKIENFLVSKGKHLMYTIYDSTGKPISSGEILVT
jgi:FlaG/FlaF family flagellin (archaellin)